VVGFFLVYLLLKLVERVCLLGFAIERGFDACQLQLLFLYY